ncbi:MAG: hypothetical protein ACREAA_12280 [Candidatus Polarisedimenticolia bacterium]
MIQRLIPVLLLVFCGPLLAGEDATSRPAEPVSVDDIARMLRSGVQEDVILMQVNAVGVSSEPTAADLMSLKSAGASDRLLDAILHPAETGPARVIVRVGANGRKVVHLTNLDDSGRRLGGEVPRPARMNVVSEAVARADRRPGRRDARSAERPAVREPAPPPEAPVDTGEVYVEEVEETEGPVGEFPSLPLGTPVSQLLGAQPVGFSPVPGAGFSPVPGVGFPTAPAVGFPFAWGSNLGALVAPVSPPGSWSHYLKHHHRETSTVRRTRHIHPVR